MIEKVVKTIEAYQMLKPWDCVIVGVSGGADSCALLHALWRLQKTYFLRLEAVHVHHGLRQEEADRDEAFVRAFCSDLSINCNVFHHQIAQEAQSLGIGLEEAGRIARYRDFQRVCEAIGGGRIAVAHHANDQAETVLLHLARGTGLRGLTGIVPVRGNIIRPLLDCTRDEIEDYCEKHHISYQEDSTNGNRDYTRNKIRLDFLPWLCDEINPQAVRHISTTAHILRQEDQYLNQESKNILEKAVIEKTETRISLDKGVLLSCPQVLLRRAVRLAYGYLTKDGKDLAFSHICAVTALLEKETGASVNLPFGIRASAEYGKLILDKNVPQEPSEFCYEIWPEKTYYVKEIGKYIRISQEKPNEAQIGEERIYLNDNHTTFPLELRTRRPKDTIALKGIRGRKKIKDFFIDEKIPRQKRQSIPLLAMGSDILWIVGLRKSRHCQPQWSEETSLCVQIWED